MGDTSIEWTEKTWNPVTGCSKVSPGCAHCYAEQVALRFWRNPPRAFTDVCCHEDRLDQPLRWRTPKKVFVNSMSDLFHEDVPDAFIDKIFAVMAIAKEHTFQILTKRAERMRAYMTGGYGFRVAEELLPAAIGHVGAEAEVVRLAHRQGVLHLPLSNVWLGVSVENQRFADERIPLLLQTPAAVRFISAEPLLAPVDLKRHVQPRPDATLDGILSMEWIEILDWVIVGGESGPGARPFDLTWARSIVQQCRVAGVPCFYKQGGASNRCRHDSKGGCFDCFPRDLQVREFPNAERS